MCNLKICFCEFMKSNEFHFCFIPLLGNDNERTYTLYVNKNISIKNLEKAINKAITSLQVD